jgi:PncC family amidohydrolase
MYPQEHDSLAHSIGEALLARSATLAVVETTAGGLISARLLSVPGASQWFDRGVVAYSRAAKQELSANAEAILDEHGAVSREFVDDVLEQVWGRTGADYVVGESGIAGPQTGRRSAKPVGSAVIAVFAVPSTRIEEHVFPGSRVEVMMAIADRALAMLYEQIERDGEPV